MVLSNLTDEEKIIIGLTFLLSCITIPLMHSRMKRLKSLHPTIQKKVKTITILQIVCFVLVVFKVLTIRLINCGIFSNGNVSENFIYFLEFINLVCMVGLIVCISIMNGIWWEFYYTSFDYFGRTYIAILLFSIICLAWIPFTLKNTFFPEELMKCMKNLDFNFSKSLSQMFQQIEPSSQLETPIKREPGEQVYQKIYPRDIGEVFTPQYKNLSKQPNLGDSSTKKPDTTSNQPPPTRKTI